MHELPSVPSPAFFVPLLLVGLLALARAQWRFVLFGLAGVAWTAHCASERLAERLPAAELGHDFTLHGWVDGFPTVASGQSTFSFAVGPPRPAGVPARVRLTWYDPPAELAPGATLAVVARLKPPRGLRNPRGFDYERWLLVAGYGATGYVRSGTVESTAERGLAERWLRYRAHIAERLAAAAPDADSAALLIALAIGERFGFTEQHWSDFRRTGTSHLVAVSGLHVALIGVCVFAALRRAWLYLPSPLARFDLEAAAIASAAATVWYAALTGFAVPAQRSAVMIVVALAVLASRRRIPPLHALAVALVLVLALDPFAPLAASFWLSFGAVALLILLGGPRRVGAPRSKRGALHSAAQLGRLQWGISFGLLPLTVLFFAECSLVGPFANLIAIPVFNFLLVPLTLAATLLVDAAPLGATLTHATGMLAGWTLEGLHALAEWRWAAVQLPQPPIWAAVLAACGVSCAIAAPPVPGRRLAWLALLPLFVPRVERVADGAVRAVVLDVGHGLAVLVETRAHRLLYDAGPRYPSGFDLGDEVAVPAIDRGRGGLDLLVVSHADNDHAGGAAAVLRAFPDAHVLHGPDVTELPAERRVCVAGQQWTWDGVQFSVLHPHRSFGARGNDSSCVLRVAARDFTLLLTGDVEALGERVLVESETTAADVVIVPHHGSATSSTPRFVSSTHARWALVSSAHANRWSLPRTEVRARWQAAGARMLATADAGALTVRSTADGIAITPERTRRRRYWDPE